jgi:hypothetical protein
MGIVRARPRLAVVFGVGALAVGGLVAGAFVLNSRGRGVSATPTTGPYAPIAVSRPKIYTMAGAVLNDPEASVSANLNTLATQLPGTYRYRITISNTSNVGFIDSFQWYPPTGVRIVRVLGSSAGSCGLSGLTGFGGAQFTSVVLYPNITCRKVNLKPPSCTCLGDGGTVDVSFVADRPLGGIGTANMISARLVLHPVPSYLKPETGSAGQGSSG